MEQLHILKRPELNRPSWVSAFVGWADAQEGASQAMRHLIRSLPAEKFAEIDPEEFYDFTLVRPVIYHDSLGRRRLRWPKNEFYSWKRPEGGEDVILFLGTEPNLKWRTFLQTMLQAVNGYDLQLVAHLGCLLDALPHTREPVVTANGNKDSIKGNVGGLRMSKSTYQGPAGITSAFMDACTRADLDYLSIWAHAPHYVQHGPNFKVVKALVTQVNEVFNLHAPVDELDRRGQAFEAEVTKAVAGNAEVSAYVKRLEQQYDETVAKQQGGLPSPKTMVEEIEKYLRGENPGSSYSPN